MRIVAGIDQACVRAEQLGEVASALFVGWDSRQLGSTLVVSVLFPGKEKECLVMAIIKFWNAHWPTEAAAKIVLMVSGLWLMTKIVIPRIGVQLVVAIQLKGGAMVGICTGFCSEALHAPRGAAKFGGNC